MSIKLTRLVCHAGMLPHNSPALVVIASAKTMTGVIRRRSASDGSMYIGSSDERRMQDPDAGHHAEQPAGHRQARALGERLAPEVRAAVAPSDARIAISCWRALPRASSRLAIFTQAINTTNITAASSTHRWVFTSLAMKSPCSGATLADQPAFDFG